MRRTSLQTLALEGRDLFRAGRYTDAIRVFELGRTQAEAAQLNTLAVRAIGNVGACEFALHRYQDALRTLLQAHRMAESIGDHSLAALFDANIASLYSDLGELDAAAEWTQGILQRLSPADRRGNEPKLLLQMATLRARQQRMPEAEALFAKGLDAADRAADLTLYATGWNRLGEEYLKQHNLPAAEAALLEAYRIRKLNHLALDSSYRSLGMLRLEQGDLASASELLDRAVELSARPEGPLPAWNVYAARGRVRLAQGRLPHALDDLRIAIQLARDWRWSAPPADAALIGAEGGVEQVYAALIEAGNRLYLETHDSALIRETFEAAEENRAGSLRELLATRRDTDAAKLPPAYWDALGRLQRAEVHSLRSETRLQPPARRESAAAEVSAIRAELSRMELALGPVATPLPTALLDRTRAALDPGAALLSFHLGDRYSWMWALDRDGLVLHRLPARGAIEPQVQAAADALRTDSAGADLAAAQLYRTLFGTLDERFQHKTQWLLALDRGLFDAPFAALRTGDAYLTEQHAIEIIPGAGFWIDAVVRPHTPVAPVFVGLGDAIYNTADPRLARQPAAKSPLLLPRLVASGREVEDCARAFGGDRVLLQGEDASRANLLRQLARNPAVVHLATHVLKSGDQPAQGLIALSLTPRHENELLPPQEIAGWRTGAGVVVMSGCHSAAGRALPGTGLLGLTRAWLVAGARSVIASNWATPDENGGLFSALYRNLASGYDAGPAAALRAAQLEMIRAGGWRARPRYWGAYFVVGAG